MADILVSSIEHSEEVFRNYQPSFVISISDTDETAPFFSFKDLPQSHHVEIVEQDHPSQKDRSQQAEEHCKQLINITEKWDKASPILIHCHRGVARSMAAAYIMMCACEPEASEVEIAKRLRKAAPHADPNILLVSAADNLLGRDDRMVEAILDLCPSSSTIDAPLVILPVSA